MVAVPTGLMASRVEDTITASPAAVVSHMGGNQKKMIPPMTAGMTPRAMRVSPVRRFRGLCWTPMRARTAVPPHTEKMTSHSVAVAS